MERLGTTPACVGQQRGPAMASAAEQEISALDSDKLRRMGLGGVHALLLLLLLGLVNTFWLELPEDEASGSMWGEAKPLWMLVAHILIAVIVLAFALMITVVAFKGGDSYWKGVSVVALLGILIGFGAGMGFMGSGDDITSFVMALGCVVAIGAYASGLARR